ncbi:izumo sperm-egg fusion protein 2 [Suncus etruscus]|uniref:izumo sperm-egg fusion protein 2 n=1 Tax=Suncus etruscus TaxID=109475 RepID=UPI00210FBAEF|nr:izumo sperm-egg fusion protein 2 [Suncus etruscus]
MQLAWALLLLLLAGLSAPRVRGCLQCDPSVREVLNQLHAVLIPSHLSTEELEARAQIMLLGMMHRFFRDYSVNAFVGKDLLQFWPPSAASEVNDLQLVAKFVKSQAFLLKHSSLKDEALLSALEDFRKRITKKLKRYLRSYERKACDPKICKQLKEEILDCLHCERTTPKCIPRKMCFVDRQPRMELRYLDTVAVRSHKRPAIIISVCLSVLLLGVIVVAALTYRENRKILLR